MKRKYIDEIHDSYNRDDFDQEEPEEDEETDIWLDADDDNDEVILLKCCSSHKEIESKFDSLKHESDFLTNNVIPCNKK
jgi:hypothetical protein